MDTTYEILSEILPPNRSDHQVDPKYEVRITVHSSGLLAQGTFSATVGVVAFVRVYPDAHFELLSILIFDHE